MSEPIHGYNENGEDNFSDTEMLFSELENADLGPLHAKEKHLKDAREAMLLQFEDMAQGGGGDSQVDAVETYQWLASDINQRFYELMEFAHDYIGKNDKEKFITYFADEFVKDENIRHDRMLSAVNLSYDDNNLDLELAEYDDYKTIARIYTLALWDEKNINKNEAQDYDEVMEGASDDIHFGWHTNDGSQSPMMWAKGCYEDSVASIYDVLCEYLPQNINDSAKHERYLLNKSREILELQRVESMRHFLGQVAANALGTGIAIGVAYLFRRRK